jgi:hypothetical protein
MTTTIFIADPVRKERAENRPKIETADKEFSLYVGQFQISLDQSSSIRRNTNIISQVARINGGTEGKDVGGSRNLERRITEITVVLSFMGLVDLGPIRVGRRHGRLTVRPTKVRCYGIDLVKQEETVTVCGSLEATQKTMAIAIAIAIARSDAD